MKVSLNDYLDDRFSGEKIKVVLLDGEDEREFEVICSGFGFPDRLYFEGYCGTRGYFPFVGENGFGISKIYSKDGELVYQNESLEEESGILELTFPSRNEMEKRGEFFF